MTPLSSRERFHRTLNFLSVDHVPCSFMSFSALRKRLGENLFELALAEKKLGLDAFLFIPTASRPQRPDHPDLRGLPIRFHSDVVLKEWKEEVVGDFPILRKEYVTPAGSLATSVRLSDDWPHGDHIPFIDDYQIPRSIKPLITQSTELDKLQFLLISPQEGDIIKFQAEAKNAHDFVKQNDLLLVGGWGVGMDMAYWLCGMQNLMMLMIEQPDFVAELLEMIQIWNMKRMKIVLSSPVDLYLKRAWYEGCDFATPRFYRNHILPRLKREVDLAHEHGAKFGYICSSGTKPMLDYYIEAGIDVLIGIDPVQGTHTDIPLMKSKLDKRICLWGGVSGAVIVEKGNEQDIRRAVREAITGMGPEGFILSPVDNITVDEPLTWQNINIFIDEWRKNW